MTRLEINERYYLPLGFQDYPAKNGIEEHVNEQAYRSVRKNEQI